MSYQRPFHLFLLLSKLRSERGLSTYRETSYQSFVYENIQSDNLLHALWQLTPRRASCHKRTSFPNGVPYRIMVIDIISSALHIAQFSTISFYTFKASIIRCRPKGYTYMWKNPYFLTTPHPPLHLNVQPISTCVCPSKTFNLKWLVRIFDHLDESIPFYSTHVKVM